MRPWCRPHLLYVQYQHINSATHDVHGKKHVQSVTCKASQGTYHLLPLPYLKLDDCATTYDQLQQAIIHFHPFESKKYVYGLHKLCRFTPTCSHNCLSHEFSHIQVFIAVSFI